MQLADHRDLSNAGTVEGATEWYPPPRLLLVRETSELFIAQVTGIRGPEAGTGLVLLGQFVDEKSRLFVAAFRALG